MNKRIIFSICLVFTFFFAFSQDTLYLLNQKKIICRVLRTNVANVIYSKNDTLAKVKEILVPKSQVRLIAYANGNFEILSLKKIMPSEINSMFIKGGADATKYYTDPGGSVGTGIASFATGGILGLIPAIACSSTKPKITNLGLPKDAPVTNRDYMLGYFFQAKKMKQKKVWTGYTVGILSLFALLLLTKH